MVTVDSVVYICFSFSFVCILSLTYLTLVKLVLMRYTKRASDDFPFGGFLSKCLFFSFADEVVVELVEVDVLTNNNL